MKKLDKSTQILFTGFCINLSIGILYAWSVFKKALVSDLGWSNSDASLPYTVAIIIFSLALLVAGMLQDRMGPRRVVILGAVMVGLGMIASSFAATPAMLVMTFGVIVGCGIGFGYACLSPAAMKWFHPSKKGLVNGVITAGFGLGALYLAPVTSSLIAEFGINTSFMILGAAIILIAVPLASTINNPPQGYEPQVPANASNKANPASKPADINWRDMLKTPQFYSLWIMFAFASSAGLMIIGNITSIAGTQAGISDAAYLVGIIAVFNCCGRFGGGVLSDKIGGLKTLMLAFVMQGINMTMFVNFDSGFTLMIGAATAGAGYGMLLAVFPSLTAGFYGLKNYGANYGVLYTAWGISGFIGPIVAAVAMDTSGSYTLGYTMSAAMVGIALILAFVTKPVDAVTVESVTSAGLSQFVKTGNR